MKESKVRTYLKLGNCKPDSVNELNTLQQARFDMRRTMNLKELETVHRFYRKKALRK